MANDRIARSIDGPWHAVPPMYDGIAFDVERAGDANPIVVNVTRFAVAMAARRAWRDTYVWNTKRRWKLPRCIGAAPRHLTR